MKSGSVQSVPDIILTEIGNANTEKSNIIMEPRDPPVLPNY